MGIILLTREIPNFLKSVMVLNILTWLICIAQVFKSPHTGVCVCVSHYNMPWRCWGRWRYSSTHRL